MKRSSADSDPDETLDLHKLIAEVVSNPDKWLDTENDQLGGNKPRNLMGTPNEDQIRALMRAIKHGMPT